MVVLPSERGSRGGARQPVMVGDRRGSKSGVRCCVVAARAIQTAQAHVPEMDAGEAWLLSRATCGGSRPAQAPACTAAVVCPRACTARSLGALLRPPAAPTPAPASLKRASRPRGHVWSGLGYAAVPPRPTACSPALPERPQRRAGLPFGSACPTRLLHCGGGPAAPACSLPIRVRRRREPAAARGTASSLSCR